MDNAWFVGYTPKLSTAVWVGYPQGNIPMPNGFGGALAAPIWHDFMESASNGYCGDWGIAERPVLGHRVLRAALRFGQRAGLSGLALLERFEAATAASRRGEPVQQPDAVRAAAAVAADARSTPAAPAWAVAVAARRRRRLRRRRPGGGGGGNGGGGGAGGAGAGHGGPPTGGGPKGPGVAARAPASQR